MKKISAITFLIIITNLTFANSKTDFSISKNLDIFASVLKELNLFYVDSLDQEKLLKTAVGEMLAELDPYTTYIPEQETEDLKRMTTGEYGGVGSVIMQHGEAVVFSEPYENMPAHRAGFKCGDVIEAIDGRSVKGKTTAEVSGFLRGVPGTTVSVEVRRNGQPKPIKRDLVREKIQLHPVEYYTLLEGSVGYILFSEFTTKAYDEFRAAVLDLQRQGAKKLIVDLRGNGGGLIDEAVEIASLFVPKGTEIVSTKGRKNSTVAYKTKREPIAEALPLAMLVNQTSASASEILAGAFQDLDRAVIVGERTFGKGLVQSIRPIDYKGFLKVTTAKYYIPSGRCVQAIDYARRDDEGAPLRTPDSLTHEFKTKKGRIVRDGGGITPDSVVLTNKKKINISHYLYAKNIIFDFATEFELSGRQISSPEEFNLSEKDYEQFKDFVKKVPNFSYNNQSEKRLKELDELIDFEGYKEIAKNELEALKEKIKPNLEQDLEHFKKEISDLIQYEIIKRYYFQKGTIRYSLREDEFVKKALETLSEI